MAAELDYVPLPASLIEQVKKTWSAAEITLGRHAGVGAANAAGALACRRVERPAAASHDVGEPAAVVEYAGAKLTPWRIIDPQARRQAAVYERMFRGATLAAALLVLLILGRRGALAG